MMMMMMMMLMVMKCAMAFTLQFSKAIEERETILMEKMSTGLDNDDEGHIAIKCRDIRCENFLTTNFN